MSRSTFTKAISARSRPTTPGRCGALKPPPSSLHTRRNIPNDPNPACAVMHARMHARTYLHVPPSLCPLQQVTCLERGDWPHGRRWKCRRRKGLQKSPSDVQLRQSKTLQLGIHEGWRCVSVWYPPPLPSGTPSPNPHGPIFCSGKSDILQKETGIWARFGPQTFGLRTPTPHPPSSASPNTTASGERGFAICQLPGKAQRKHSCAKPRMSCCSPSHSSPGRSDGGDEGSGRADRTVSHRRPEGMPH